MLHACRIWAAGLIVCIPALVAPVRGISSREGQAWRDSFTVDRANLADTGRNTYFVLEPDHRLHFEHDKDTLVISVLDETKVVDGVQTRVVEERETKNGKLVEISRNYFAIDRTTQDIYYFGEDVDIYKDGRVVGHEGAWLSGVNGARFGLMMPGKPEAGDRHYQEVAPGIALDRAEILSVAEGMKVPAGTFAQCLHTKESSTLEGGTESKWYAPGVGLIRDADFVLVKFETGAR
ncbi:MAG: hypothetical protein ABIG68_03335 [Acidobacteriota bacterium]